MNEDEKELILAQDKAQDKAQDEIVNEKISNMNEEEKEAIEKLDYELTYSWVHNQGISKETLKLFKDIIEKQQKEIEKLKDDLREERALNRGAFETLKECVHKDKIKEKMRGEINKSWRNTEQRKCQLYAYDILKELLGE